MILLESCVRRSGGGTHCMHTVSTLPMNPHQAYDRTDRCCWCNTKKIVRVNPDYHGSWLQIQHGPFEPKLQSYFKSEDSG